MIAALFVHKNGTYFGLPNVDPWDKARDARKYPGPHPVVAHPPCYGLPAPASEGWQRVMCGGWVAHVEQGRYGHVAKKATWLYSHGCDELPSLSWGLNPDGASKAIVSWCGNHTKSGEVRPRVGKDAAAKTPIEFRDILISIARASQSAKASDV